MEQKGVRGPPLPGVWHHRTRATKSNYFTKQGWDELSRNWQKKFNIHKRTTTSSLEPLKRHTFESETPWSPCILHRCRETRIDRLRHPRLKDPTLLLGRNHRRNGLCMLGKDCSESGVVHGISQAHTPEKVQRATRQ